MPRCHHASRHGHIHRRLLSRHLFSAAATRRRFDYHAACLALLMLLRHAFAGYAASFMHVFIYFQPLPRLIFSPRLLRARFAITLRQMLFATADYSMPLLR